MDHVRFSTNSMLVEQRFGYGYREAVVNAFVRFRTLSKSHLLAIIFALATGVFVLAPQIIFIAKEGDHYQGFYMMNREAEPYYLARMQEYYDTGRIGNPYLFEYKYYGPQFLQSGAETILAIPGKVLGISIPTLNLIYKFLLPAITFLLLYALIFRLTASLPWSIAGALFYLVGINVLYVVNLPHLLRGDLWFDGFVYNRPVHPQFDGIHFFAYLNVLLTIFKNENIRDIESERRPDISPWFERVRSLGSAPFLAPYRWHIVLAALLGLSFYTYFYSFTFFLALNFVFILFWLCFGKKILAWRLILATIGGILLGVPKLLVMYAATQHPEYASLVATFELVSGHRPELSKNGVLVLLFFLIYFFRTKALRVFGIMRNTRAVNEEALSRGRNTFFLLGLMLTTFVAVNQQVLTGMRVQSGHYHHNYNMPIFAIVLAFLASAIVSHLRNRGSENFVPNSEVSIAPLRSRAFLSLYPSDRFLRALPWLASIIFFTTGALIQYSSYQNWAARTSSEQRFMQAFAWLKTETPKESVVMANEELSGLITVFTSNNVMWAHTAGNYLMPVERRRFTPENLLQSNDFLFDIKQYRVDYILWDQYTDPNWNIHRLQLPQLFSADGLIIYQLPK